MHTMVLCEQDTNAQTNLTLSCKSYLWLICLLVFQVSLIQIWAILFKIIYIQTSRPSVYNNCLYFLYLCKACTPPICDSG